MASHMGKFSETKFSESKTLFAESYAWDEKPCLGARNKVFASENVYPENVPIWLFIDVPCPMTMSPPPDNVPAP